MRRKIIALSLVVLLVVCLTLAFAAPALAQGPPDMPAEAATGLEDALSGAAADTAGGPVLNNLLELTK